MKITFDVWRLTPDRSGPYYAQGLPDVVHSAIFWHLTQDVKW